MAKGKHPKLNAVKQPETLVDRILRKAKNQPILAVIVVIAVVLIGIGSVIESSEKIKTTLKNELATVSSNTNNDATGIVADYLGVNRSNLKVVTTNWFDLTGKGVKNEFWIEYETSNRTRAIALFSIANGSPQRLFYQQDFYTDGYVVRYDDRQYLVVTSTDGGMAGYLDISVYDWDGIGPLRQVFNTADPDESLFKGKVYIIDGHLYADGNNQRFYLARQNGVFSLNRYIRRPKYPEMGQANHILSFNLYSNQLQMTFDNIPISFEPVAADKLKVKSPVQISKNDSIVIDDNLTESREVRVLIDGNKAVWRPGFFSSVVPHDNCEISVSDNYALWYEVKVQVVDYLKKN